MPKPKFDDKKVVDAQGHMLLPLDGAEYVLRPSYKAIKVIQHLLGRSLIQLSSQAVAGQLTEQDLAIIAAEMMRAYAEHDPQAGPSYAGAKPENLEPMIYEAGVPAIMARIGIVLVAAVNGGYTAEGEVKPAR